MAILVTGAAGFIGYHLCERLLAEGRDVIGLDEVNDYYDPGLKEARLERLANHGAFRMVRGNIATPGLVAQILEDHDIRHVVHLAAQAGVRYSIDNPMAYQKSNLEGHLQILEACRRKSGFEHLVYASSSSVYGNRPQSGEAFCETDSAVDPVSLYAATKRSGELLSTSYSHLYGLCQTGLRFFTVYGPFGRPDMAYFSFTRSILAGQPIEVFGEGRMERDFTYVDDIVQGILAALACPPDGQNRILNIGAGQPAGLMEMIAILEQHLGCEAIKVFKPMQPGDVRRTYADLTKLQSLTGYRPEIDLNEGLRRFVAWYRNYYPS